MGARGKKCPVCSIPALAAQVQAERDAGSSYAQIAASTGVNKFSISRHFRHAGQAAAATPSGDPLAASDARLAELTQRMEATWIACCSNSEVRAGLDALKVLCKLALEDRARIVKKIAEAAETSDKPEPNSPEELDRLVRRYESAKYERLQQIEAARKKGYIDCPLCSTAGAAGNLVHPSAIAHLWPAVRDLYNAFCDKKEAEARDLARHRTKTS